MQICLYLKGPIWYLAQLSVQDQAAWAGAIGSIGLVLVTIIIWGRDRSRERQGRVVESIEADGNRLFSMWRQAILIEPHILAAKVTLDQMVVEMRAGNQLIVGPGLISSVHLYYVDSVIKLADELRAFPIEVATLILSAISSGEMFNQISWETPAQLEGYRRHTSTERTYAAAVALGSVLDNLKDELDGCIKREPALSA